MAFDDAALAALFDHAVRHHLRGVGIGVGGPAKRCSLHGPGRPLTSPHPELALVPHHPRSGLAWPTPPGTIGVPLDLAIWSHLAFPRTPFVHIPGPLRAELDRDDPVPPRWYSSIWFDRRLIHDLLARHPGGRRG
ncbi:hypothetical protein [Kitasatospora sp. NPDC004531]